MPPAVALTGVGCPGEPAERLDGPRAFHHRGDERAEAMKSTSGPKKVLPVLGVVRLGVSRSRAPSSSATAQAPALIRATTSLIRPQ